MNPEPFYTQSSSRDIKRDLDAQLSDYESRKREERGVVINPVKVDETPRKIESLKSRAYSKDEFYAMIARHAVTFEKLGIQDVRITSNSFVVDFEKNVYACRIEGRGSHNTLVLGWIVLDEGTLHEGLATYSYNLHWNNDIQLLDVIQLPATSEFAWVQSESERAKIVKSRPMWMYPELFNLPHDEVWPRNADIAVIGDPYQLCDRDRTTIIEYEYADEMVPPILQAALLEGVDSEAIGQSWLRNLYREDIHALDNIFPYAPHSANPYKAFAERCISFINGCVHKLSQSEKLSDNEEVELKKLKEIKSLLIDGDWTLDDGRALLQSVNISHHSDENEEEDLRKWHEYKEESLNGLGNLERWQEFVRRWEEYISGLPNMYLVEHMASYEKQLAQARHWLSVLPTTKSIQRCQKGRNYLSDFYDSLAEYYDKENAETFSIIDPSIQFIEERGLMADNVLGYFQPGSLLSRRQQNTLNELFRRSEQVITYSQTIHGHLEEERARIAKNKIPLSQKMIFQYLRSFEYAYARQHFFYKRTQRSVPVHGFFPHDMAPIDQQDRILALTSVTMHGWNNLKEEQFLHDIEAALPYLKIGGKYILGPINQAVYFGSPVSDFACDDLMSALLALKADGKIEYKFNKGRRGFVSGYDDIDRDDPTESWSEDPNTLMTNESAHSLVITRVS